MHENSHNTIRSTDGNVVDGIAVPVYTLDREGRCTGINAAATRLLGWEAADCMGRNMHELLHYRHVDGTPYPADQCPLVMAAREGSSILNLKDTLWLKSGEVISVVCSVAPLGEDRGSVITLNERLSAEDVRATIQAVEAEQQETLRQRDAAARAERELVLAHAAQQRESSAVVERVAAEQLRAQQEAVEDRLLENEKLAAVGRLAASISHEINNPLEAVTNLLYLIRSDPSLSSEACDYLASAEKELARVSEIVSQTLRFQRTGKVHMECQPEALVESVAALHQGRLHHSGIRIARQHRRSAKFFCAEGDVRQILNNLLGNAIDAMKDEGGTITVRTQPARCPRTGRNGMRITVADMGHGMSAKTVAQIFEPFYTTKGASGSGLGLWISHSIAKRHGGTLRVRSSRQVANHGTAFSLFLPDSSTSAPCAENVQ